MAQFCAPAFRRRLQYVLEPPHLIESALGRQAELKGQNLVTVILKGIL